MARTADKTDSYIAMVLDLNGRVRPADLQSVPAESRLAALRSFAEAHGAAMELHLVGEELVAGPMPDPAAFEFAPLVPTPPTPAPVAEPQQPADLTLDGQSAIDLLLGDYDGMPTAAGVLGSEPEPEPGPDPVSALGQHPVAPSAAEAPSHGSLPSRSTMSPRAVPSAPAAVAMPTVPAAPRDTARAWLFWWIPTLLIPLVGGSAAWCFLRNKRQFAARAMLATALVLGVLLSAAWLLNAERIAAIADQRAADSVIVLPDSQATPDPGSANTAAPDSPSSNTQ